MGREPLELIDKEKLLREAEISHEQFLVGSYIEGIESTPQGNFLYSTPLKDAWLNIVTHLTATSSDVPALIKKAKSFYLPRKRSPAFYCALFTQQELIDAFKRHGCKEAFCDVWMFLPLSESRKVEGSSIRLHLCSSSEDGELFIATYMKSYSGVDPHEPYGALPEEYREAKRQFLATKIPGREICHFLIMRSDECVGCVEIGVDKHLAGLYALGIVPAYRGKIFPRTIATLCVNEARARGATTAFLQTEAGSYNEKLFARMGFVALEKKCGLVLS